MSASSVTIRSSSPSQSSSARAEAAVERPARPAVAALADEQDRQRPVVGRDERGGVVGRAVVDDDDVTAGPELGPLLEVEEQARQVGLLVEGRHHEDMHQDAPRRARTTGTVWNRIFMSHQSDQLVT